MSAVGLILLASASVYGLRVSGLLLQNVHVPEMFERTLRFAPIALVSALAASGLSGQVQSEPTRLFAAIGAGVLVYFTQRMWAGIFGGFALYWMVKMVVG